MSRRNSLVSTTSDEIFNWMIESSLPIDVSLNSPYSPCPALLTRIDTQAHGLQSLIQFECATCSEQIFLKCHDHDISFLLQLPLYTAQDLS